MRHDGEPFWDDITLNTRILYPVESQTPSQDERRRAHRIQLSLFVQIRVGEGQYQNLEVVDIGIGSVQIRSYDFEALKEDFDFPQQGSV